MVADASQIVGPESASQLAVTPDGSSIAVATDLEVKLFDVLTSRELGTFNLRDPISPSPELDERQSALVNGSKLMGFVSSQPDLLLADPQRQCVWTIGVDRSKPHALTGTRLVSLESSPTCLSVFPEAGSGQFAVGLSSGKVCVYKNKALAFTHDIGGESPIPLSLEFSRDGKLLLIGGQASMGEDTVGFLHILDMTKPRGSVNITSQFHPILSATCSIILTSAHSIWQKQAKALPGYRYGILAPIWFLLRTLRSRNYRCSMNVWDFVRYYQRMATIQIKRSPPPRQDTGL